MLELNKLIKLVGVFFCVIGSSLFAIGQNGTLNLMPVPKSVKQSQSHYRVDKGFTIGIVGNTNQRIYSASTRFLRRLDGRTGQFFKQGFLSNKDNSTDASLLIEVSREGNVVLGEDESYKLKVSKGQVHLKAITDIGAIRGLETILQLLNSDADGYYIEGVEIDDAPRFAWRGLMIDAARHFMPIDVIKRNIDAMAAVKLNILHFHLSDDQGFRVESKVYPKLHENASDGLYYTHEQIKEIVAYAAERGIRVMPELDVPGHGTAILTAYPELGSGIVNDYEIERNAGIFDPTLNPTIEETYTFLDAIFKEWSALFPDEYFHIGGDENEGKQWDANKDIQKYMKKHRLKTNHDLQTMFNIRLEKILKKYGKKLMGWEEIMTSNMPTTALIHSWRGANEGMEAGGSLVKAAKNDYFTVLSNGYYIDLLYKVKDHYLVDPLMAKDQLTSEEIKRVLGGEATMWSELVTPATVDSRIWPRTAAIAERLWSPAHIVDIDDMHRRMSITSLKLEELGLTHIKNRQMILRNICNGYDTKPIENLINIVEPLKGYTRNSGGTMYKSYSPYSLFADAAGADAKDARIFNKAVDSLLKGDKKQLELIKDYLTIWSKNHEAVKKIIAKSPVLKEIEVMSENLSKLGVLGLEILDRNDKSIETDQVFKKRAGEIIEASKAQGGRTELQIVDKLNSLLLAL